MAIAMEGPGAHRLRHTGASILSGSDSIRSGSPYAQSVQGGGSPDAAPERAVPSVPMPGGALPSLEAPWIPQLPGDLPFGMESTRSGSSVQPEVFDERPPSASKSGLLYSNKAPSLEPYTGLAQNIPVLQKAAPKRFKGPPEQVPKAIWSDSVAHLPSDEEWPLHAVPLFIFGGIDRPRPAYREELKFTLRNDKYVSFALRLRCGTGDHYMGGTVGLMHSPERQEALVGDKGQLVTIIDLVVQPDNSVIVTAIGDLEFVVARTWMPRGLRGLQLAFVDVHKAAAPPLQPILQTCNEEPGFGLFGQLLARAAGFEEVAAAMGGADGPFTVFVPRDPELMSCLGGGSLQEMLRTPQLPALLACHIVRGRVPFEALYTGRTLRAIDGTILMVTFTQWPRGGPCINEIPGDHMDIFCSNGVIHVIRGVLQPAPRPAQRR
mmetsp:Transcript_26898/g.62464  ORF Transcript_26898/g.62464 Transcript_26898/m.62464 type:complete len:435 (+) Transcript_26898:29-1333(+)